MSGVGCECRAASWLAPSTSSTCKAEIQEVDGATALVRRNCRWSSRALLAVGEGGVVLVTDVPVGPEKRSVT